MGEREGLIGRIRQLRRTSVMSTMPPPRAAPAGDPPEAHALEVPAPELQALEARVAHLERLVEALQDSVASRVGAARASGSPSSRLGCEPAALSVALSKDARERGL